MNCASFENRLTEWLEGQSGDAKTLAELRQHVAECPECASAAPLVDWAALPPSERDPVEMPPQEYWEGFNSAVERRLEAQPVVSPWRRYAVAAAVAVALFAGWFLRGWVDPGVRTEQAVIAPGEPAGDPNWSQLEEVIGQASPEELAEALRGLPGAWSGFEASGWLAGENGIGGDWMPEADALDEIDQDVLMEWLDQLEQSERRPTS